MKTSMIALVFVVAMLSTSCATLLGGPISEEQKENQSQASHNEKFV